MECLVLWSKFGSLCFKANLEPQLGGVLNNGRASFRTSQDFTVALAQVSCPIWVRAASSCPSIAQSVALLAWFESMSRPMLSGSTKSVRMCMLVGATNDLVFKALMLSHYYWFFTLRLFHKGLFHIVTSSSFDYLEDTGNGVGSFSLHLLSVNLGNGWYHPTLALEHYKWSDLIKATSSQKIWLSNFQVFFSPFRIMGWPTTPNNLARWCQAAAHVRRPRRTAWFLQVSTWTSTVSKRQIQHELSSGSAAGIESDTHCINDLTVW